MNRINLKKLVLQKDISPTIDTFCSMSKVPLGVFDADSNLLRGQEKKNIKEQHPIKIDEDVIGWVKGDEVALLLASFLSLAAMREYEKKELARETLSKYRDLIHLYNLSEKLSLSLSSKEIARLAVQETLAIFGATNTSIMVRGEKNGLFQILAAAGSKNEQQTILRIDEGIAGQVLQTGKLEIVNDVSSNPQFVKGGNNISSLMCAPLKTKGAIMGVFNVSSQEDHTYSSEDIKLFTSVSTLVSSALTNAMLYEQLQNYSEELGSKNIQLEKEIAERKESAKALRKSEEKYRLHFDNALDVIYSVNPDLMITSISPSIEKVLGYKPEEVTIKPFTQLNMLTPESLERAYADTKRIFSGEKIDSAHYEFIAKDGSIKIGEVSSAPLYKDGKVVSVISVARDVTERIKTQEKLAESEERFRTMAESIMDGLVIVEKGKVVFVNNQLTEITGYTEDELIARSQGLDFVVPEQQEEVKPIHQEVLNKGTFSKPIEVWINRKDGTKRCISKKLSLSTKGNAVVAGYEIITDITERKCAEDQLRKSEERFRTMADSITNGLIIMEKGKIVYVNRRAIDITGYPQEELMKVWGPDLAENIEWKDEIINDIRKTGVWPEQVDAWIRRKDGSKCCVNLRFSFSSRGGQEYYGYVVITDVTEKKLAEEKLRDTTEFLNNIIESSQDGIIVSDRKGNLTRINMYLLEKLYYAQEELVGRHIVEFAPAEPGIYELASGGQVEILQDYFDNQASMITALREDSKVTNWESYYCRKDGKLIPIEQNIFYLFDAQGEKVGAVGILRDITERKKAEEQLKQTTTFLDNVFESSLDSIIVSGSKGNLERVNKAFLQLLDREENQVLGKTMSELSVVEEGDYETVYGEKVRIGKDHIDYMMTTLSQFITEGKITNWKSYVFRKDGKIIPVEVSIVNLYDAQGVQTGSVGIVRDVSQRREAEREITETTDFLENIIASSRDPIIIGDEMGTIVRTNQAFQELLHYEADEVKGKHIGEFVPVEKGGYESRAGTIVEIGDEFFQEAEQKMAELIEKGSISLWQSCYMDREGKIVPVEQTISFLCDKFGERTGVVGISRDITDRLKAEKEIISARDFLQDIFKTSLDGILVTDAVSTITMVNSSAVKILGYPLKELIGNKTQKFLETGDEIEKKGKEIQKVLMKKGSITGYEHKWGRKDGTLIDLEISIALLKDAKGNLSGSVLSFRDITERKKAEQKLIESREQLRSLASQLTLTEERERRRIATDLHDRIGQALAISKIKLGALRESTSSLGLEKDVDGIRDLLEQTIQDTRSLIFDLCPPFLYELGFEKAIEWLLEDIQSQHGIATYLKSDGKPKQFDDDIRILLYQTIRELFVNIVKHAEAENAGLTIKRDDHTISLCVEDDGRGFDESVTPFHMQKEGGFGLFRIQERFNYLGGEIKIKSKPNQGTKVFLKLPFTINHPTKKEGRK